MFPTKWYHQRGHRARPLFHPEDSDVGTLPAGALRSTILSNRLNIRGHRQILRLTKWTTKSFTTDPYADVPQSLHFVRGHRQHRRVATHPPVSTNARNLGRVRCDDRA
jgi:hypothetical protein